MNILHISASDINGGAARAAYRIHRCLVDQGEAYGLQSQMRVISKSSADPTVIGGPPKGQTKLWGRLHYRINQQARRGFRSSIPAPLSLAWPSTGMGAELHDRHLSGQIDCAHLHWIGDSTISIEEIARISTPLIWTLHDQWAFSGAEHYCDQSSSSDKDRRTERFASGYSPNSRPPYEYGRDLNRRTWLRKQKAWRHSMQVVCPSRWMAECAQRSTLMGDWPIKVIPYPIDLNKWAPCDQLQARALLNLPVDQPLLLFGANGGLADPRKGGDLLLQALQILRNQCCNSGFDQLNLVIYGQSKPVKEIKCEFPIYYYGHLHDDISLRLLYAAADAFVLPSRLDNLPNTGLEAHACGTPVVAFGSTGLVDIVEDRVTGFIAKPFDPRSLATGICWVLEDSNRRNKLAASARARAERLWAPDVIAKAYREVYKVAVHR